MTNCVECKKKIVGRSDKKFCDYVCRNNFNNRIKAKDRFASLINLRKRVLSLEKQVRKLNKSLKSINNQTTKNQ